MADEPTYSAQPHPGKTLDSFDNGVPQPVHREGPDGRAVGGSRMKAVKLLSEPYGEGAKLWHVSVPTRWSDQKDFLFLVAANDLDQAAKTGILEAKRCYDEEYVEGVSEDPYADCYDGNLLDTVVESTYLIGDCVPNEKKPRYAAEYTAPLRAGQTVWGFETTVEDLRAPDAAKHSICITANSKASAGKLAREIGYKVHDMCFI